MSLPEFTLSQSKGSGQARARSEPAIYWVGSRLRTVTGCKTCCPRPDVQGSGALPHRLLPGRGPYRPACSRWLSESGLTFHSDSLLGVTNTPCQVRLGNGVRRRTIRYSTRLEAAGAGASQRVCAAIRDPAQICRSWAKPQAWPQRTNTLLLVMAHMWAITRYGNFLSSCL